MPKNSFFRDERIKNYLKFNIYAIGQQQMK